MPFYIVHHCQVYINDWAIHISRFTVESYKITNCLSAQVDLNRIIFLNIPKHFLVVDFLCLFIITDMKVRIN